MARTNHPVTLNDLKTGGFGGGSSDAGAATNTSRYNDGVVSGLNSSSRPPSYNTLASTMERKYAVNPSFQPPKVCHIPTLAKADEAAAMLQRVVREYLPIMQRRGYNVVSISELCCCNDGLDFEPRRRRKLNKLANNVWGYNRTTWSGGRKSHTIHLRLRHPNQGNHESRMHLYEDVAGTLAHELAHCEFGPHNQQFYALMDDILEEHASLMASGLTLVAESMPAFGGTGNVLGGNNHNEKNDAAARAARLQALDGQKLGGDANFQQWMTPREAAVAAAMARHRQQQLRLRGNHCCRPCTVNEMNSEGGDEDEEEEVVIVETNPNHEARNTKDNNNRKHDERKQTTGGGRKQQEGQNTRHNNPPQPTTRTKRPPEEMDCKPSAAAKPFLARRPVDVIDLTDDGPDSDEQQPCRTDMSLWNCPRCTFRNESSFSRCGMCNQPR
ncbi:hypothetical protein ACA910_000363 [Epithemia clementina (nom. ined.)]